MIALFPWMNTLQCTTFTKKQLAYESTHIDPSCIIHCGVYSLVELTVISKHVSIFNVVSQDRVCVLVGVPGITRHTIILLLY